MAYIANNMDPEQTAHLGVVWSGLMVFASTMTVFGSAFKFI